MHQRHRIGLLSAAAATLVAPLAHAQQIPAPTPTPAPRPSGPVLLPGAENFDLSGTPRPARPTVIVTPTPAPSATPRVTPPVVLVTPAPAPRAAATVAPRPIPPKATARATPTPEASPAAALPAPAPPEIPTPVATATPVPAAQQSGLSWLWILLGTGAALAIGVAGWLLGRRVRAEPEAETPAPVVRPVAPPPPPVPVPAVPRPVARPAQPAPADPISVIFHPRHIEVTDKGAVLDFEMELLNASGASADGLKIALLMGSANPGQDGLIAGFHAAPAAQLAGPPVDLPAGEGCGVPGRLMLEAERMHVVTIGERPMFVPMVMVDLRWRGGLSLRRHAADFMIGTAGQGAKLGPIWLDRGNQRQGGLAASRYYARAAAAA